VVKTKEPGNRRISFQAQGRFTRERRYNNKSVFTAGLVLAKRQISDSQLTANDLQRLRPQSRRIVQGPVTLLLQTERNQ
jgi:hypothetical protein